MCEEESDDHEAVAKLFEINDSIHRTIERYKLIKKGDIEGASKIPKGTLGTSGAGVSKGPDNELSLIDFGGPEDSETSGQSNPPEAPQDAPKGNALEDDLLGLSLGSETYGQTGGISLGMSNGASELSKLIFEFQKLMYINTDFPNPSSGMSSPPPQNPQSTVPKPNYDPFGSISSSQPPLQQSVASPSSFFPQTQPQQTQQPLLSSVHPFAALSSPAPRQASPFQFQQSVKPAAPPPSSSALLSLSGSSNLGRSSTHSRPISNTAASNDDDEWTFASAVPDQSKDISVSNTSVNVTFNVSRESDDVILIKSRISNNTSQPVTDLTFQVAVSKVSFFMESPQYDSTFFV